MIAAWYDYRKTIIFVFDDKQLMQQYNNIFRNITGSWYWKRNCILCKHDP